MFFQWTAQEGLYPDIAQHIKGAKLSKEHKKDYLTSKQVKAVLGAMEKDTEQGRRDYAIFALMVTGGLRDIEVHRANIEDLRTLGDDTVLYLQGKGREDRTEYIKVPEAVEKAIRASLADRQNTDGTQPLFISLSNNSRGERVSTRSISGIVKRALVNAGYDSERLTAHSLRHTSGTGAHKAGIDLYGVQHLMRHCDPATSEIYIHDDDHKAAEEKGRKGIYDYYFNGVELNPVMPELEAEIMTLTSEQQKALLAQIRAQKGGNNE